jgi:hypothetical protein
MNSHIHSPLESRSMCGLLRMARAETAASMFGRHCRSPEPRPVMWVRGAGDSGGERSIGDVQASHCRGAGLSVTAWSCYSFGSSFLPIAKQGDPSRSDQLPEILQSKYDF